MKRSTSAFTLVEMLTVMAVIAILASLIVAVNGFAHKKAALLRANGEIQGLSTACENYKTDNGAYPRDSKGDSDNLDPRVDGTTTDNKYTKANIALYKELSGDHGPGGTYVDSWTGNEKPDGKPETKSYFEFSTRPDMLKKNSTGTEVQYIMDPFGNPYGYSTAGAKFEEDFRVKLQADPTAQRTNQKGYNPTYDLWSTGGLVQSGSGTLVNNQKRWVKNW